MDFKKQKYRCFMDLASRGNFFLKNLGYWLFRACSNFYQLAVNSLWLDASLDFSP